MFSVTDSDETCCCSSRLYRLYALLSRIESSQQEFNSKLKIWTFLPEKQSSMKIECWTRKASTTNLNRYGEECNTKVCVRGDLIPSKSVILIFNTSINQAKKKFSKIKIGESWNQEILSSVWMLVKSCFKGQIWEVFVIPLRVKTKFESIMKAWTANDHGNSRVVHPHRGLNQIFMFSRTCFSITGTSSTLSTFRFWIQHLCGLQWEIYSNKALVHINKKSSSWFMSALEF